MSHKVLLSLLVVLAMRLLLPADTPAQFSDAHIVSKHVRIRVPQEREWVARDAVPDLERSWQFVHKLLGEKLPRWVVVTLDWRVATTSSDADRGTVTVGMLGRAAEADPRRFILHRTARELARIGLLALSRGGAARPECQFLLDGMSEIVAHEFDHTTRALGGAWALARLADGIQPVVLPTAPQPRHDSVSPHDLRASAAGVTFLLMCQEIFGREKVLRLFESLRKNSLEESIAGTFKVSMRNAEETWLRRVRQQPIADAIVTSAEDGPVLRQFVVVPQSGTGQSTIRLWMQIADRTGDTPHDGVFVLDGSRVVAVQPAAHQGAQGLLAELPVDGQRPAGGHEVRVVAVDETGNVRVWPRPVQLN
jgi:hypothetical protein